MSVNCFTIQFPKVAKGAEGKRASAIITEGIHHAWYPQTKTHGSLAGDGIYFAGGLEPVLSQNYWLYQADISRPPLASQNRILQGSLTRRAEGGPLLVRSELPKYPVTLLRIITIDVAVPSSFGYIEDLSTQGIEMCQHQVKFQGSDVIGFFDILIEVPRDEHFRMVAKTTGGHKWTILCQAGLNTVHVTKQTARPRRLWRR